jgi:hypothetical protein
MMLIASTPMMGLLAALGLQGFLQLGFLFGRQIRVQHLATEGRHGGQHLIGRDLAYQNAERRLAER